MQKYVNPVDLVKRFPTSSYLQKSASIQPRTSLSEFGGKFNSLFMCLLRSYMDRDKIQIDRMLSDMKTAKGAVAYQMKYQDDEFRAIFNDLTKKKTDLLANVQSGLDKNNEQNTKIYTTMDDTNKAAKAGLKAMEADIGADMKTSSGDMATKLSGLQNHQRDSFGRVFLAADKNLRLAKDMETKIRETSESIDSTAADAKSSYFCFF